MELQNPLFEEKIWYSKSASWYIARLDTDLQFSLKYSMRKCEIQHDKEPLEGDRLKLQNLKGRLVRTAR